MNRVKGHITQIRKAGSVAIVTVDVKGIFMSSVILTTGVQYEIGNEVEILFKETEVIIGKNMELSISLQNRLKSTITKINKDEVLARIQLNGNYGDIESIITTNGANELDLKEGDEVVALIKSNEVMLNLC